MGWSADGPAPYRSRLSLSGGGPAGMPPGPAPGDAGDRLRPVDLVRLARHASRRVALRARTLDAPSLSGLVLAHLAVAGDVAQQLPVTVENWPGFDHVNVQTAVDRWLTQGGREHRLVGVTSYRHHDFGLAEVLAADPTLQHGPRPGPVAVERRPAGPDGQLVACVRCAFYLVEDGPARHVLLVRGPEPERGENAVTVQVVSTEPDAGAAIVSDLRALALRHNVYRQQVVSLGGELFGPQGALLTFHRRPAVSADQLVLAPGVRELIEQQVVGVARHRDRLLAAGQHLKRGLLLYGPPGVGKTHTIRWLSSVLTGSTVVLLSGEALGAISQAAQIARTLQPAILVVEDVDLIAEDRGMHPGQHPLLFQLLNEMDGLAEDADVVFVLTTNRADLLEPALASRPGRIDQAVEIALPDLDARRQLFELYRGALPVDTARLEQVLERAGGATASFLKELLRRSALLAAERRPGDGPPPVSADDLDDALEQLLDTRNAMTRTVLGAAPDVRPVAPAPPQPGLAPPGPGGGPTPS